MGKRPHLNEVKDRVVVEHGRVVRKCDLFHLIRILNRSVEESHGALITNLIGGLTNDRKLIHIFHQSTKRFVAFDGDVAVAVLHKNVVSFLQVFQCSEGSFAVEEFER